MIIPMPIVMPHGVSGNADPLMLLMFAFPVLLLTASLVAMLFDWIKLTDFLMKSTMIYMFLGVLVIVLCLIGRLI